MGNSIRLNCGEWGGYTQSFAHLRARGARARIIRWVMKFYPYCSKYMFIKERKCKKNTWSFLLIFDIREWTKQKDSWTIYCRFSLYFYFSLGVTQGSRLHFTPCYTLKKYQIFVHFQLLFKVTSGILLIFSIKCHYQ